MTPKWALMPLEGFPFSRLPTFPEAQVRVLASPRIGAEFVQYLIDRGVTTEIPAVDPVRNSFGTPHDAISLALNLERSVTEQISRLAATARDEGDYLGEQFIQWFLKEQVEEVAQMTTLVRVAERAGADLFHLEDFVAREISAPKGDPAAPKAAGGAL